MDNNDEFYQSKTDNDDEFYKTENDNNNNIYDEWEKRLYGVDKFDDIKTDCMGYIHKETNITEIKTIDNIIINCGLIMSYPDIDNIKIIMEHGNNEEKNKLINNCIGVVMREPIYAKNIINFIKEIKKDFLLDKKNIKMILDICMGYSSDVLIKLSYSFIGLIDYLLCNDLINISMHINNDTFYSDNETILTYVLSHAHCSSIDLLETILKHEPNINYAFVQFGGYGFGNTDISHINVMSTPLTYSINCGFYVAFKLLITHGADINMSIYDDCIYHTPIYIAILGRKYDFIEHLLWYGCDTSILKSEKCIPLLKSLIINEDYKIIELIKKYDSTIIIE